MVHIVRMILLRFGIMLYIGARQKYCVVYRIQWFGSKKSNIFDNSIFWFSFLAWCHTYLNSNSICKTVNNIIESLAPLTNYVACLQLTHWQCHWWHKAVCSSCVSYEGPLPRPPSLPSSHEPAKRERERKKRRQRAVRGEWGGVRVCWRWSWWMRGWEMHCMTSSPGSEWRVAPSNYHEDVMRHGIKLIVGIQMCLHRSSLLILRDIQ